MPHKVLIVDDDMRALFALTRILSDRGMHVVKAQNGQKALEVLERDGSRVAVVRSASAATLGFLFAADVVFGLLSAESKNGPPVANRPAG